ncbi:MAG: alpha/beta hydrolase, partial [Marinomonas sp.]
MDGGSVHPTDAPLHEDIARGPGGGSAHWIHTHDGLRLRAGHWPAQTSDQTPAKGTVLLFPGRTEYIEKYGDAAAIFAQNGLGTLAIDWRGQGLADRLLKDAVLGHIDEFANYQADVAAMIELATTLELPKPWFLLGHSMGGAIGLRALMEGLPVQAAAFSAPMWDIKLPGPLRPVAYGMGAFARPFGLGTHL